MPTKVKQQDPPEAKAPAVITAAMVDNTTVELTIDGTTIPLRSDELHNLRMVLDRAAVELPC